MIAVMTGQQTFKVLDWERGENRIEFKEPDSLDEEDLAIVAGEAPPRGEGPQPAQAPALAPATRGGGSSSGGSSKTTSSPSVVASGGGGGAGPTPQATAGQVVAAVSTPPDVAAKIAAANQQVLAQQAAAAGGGFFASPPPIIHPGNGGQAAYGPPTKDGVYPVLGQWPLAYGPPTQEGVYPTLAQQTASEGSDAYAKAKQSAVMPAPKATSGKSKAKWGGVNSALPYSSAALAADAAADPNRARLLEVSRRIEAVEAAIEAQIAASQAQSQPKQSNAPLQKAAGYTQAYTLPGETPYDPMFTAEGTRNFIGAVVDTPLTAARDFWNWNTTPAGSPGYMGPNLADYQGGPTVLENWADKAAAVQLESDLRAAQGNRNVNVPVEYGARTGVMPGPPQPQTQWVASDRDKAKTGIMPGPPPAPWVATDEDKAKTGIMPGPPAPASGVIQLQPLGGRAAPGTVTTSSMDYGPAVPAIPETMPTPQPQQVHSSTQVVSNPYAGTMETAKADLNAFLAGEGIPVLQTQPKPQQFVLPLPPGTVQGMSNVQSGPMAWKRFLSDPSEIWKQ